MRPVLLAAIVLIACSHSPAPSAPALGDGKWRPVGQEPQPPARGRAVTISIVGTNDLHGALERLPLFAGFVANLRAARAADGGGVVLVDGGDLFQGTLESNLGEGAEVVQAYNRLGYAGVAIGNHEFDYGPVGPAVTPTGPGDDPRGALKARASEAKFPFLASNIVDNATGSRILWPNMPGSTMIEVAGVKIGIIGASTESTPNTTMPANFAGLRISPAAQAIADHATALRGQGARIIIATMHIGTRCKEFDRPDDTSSCDRREELFRLLGDLPRGAVDVIVGGHTHAGVAHLLDGIPVIESYSSGRAFGRVDLTLGPDGKIADVHIDKPHLMCPVDKNFNPVPVADCHPDDYEGKPVTPDPGIQKIVDAALARAGARRQEKLGVVLASIVKRAWATESPEGNLFTDLMLEARPDAHVALANGGGLRADLPAGTLTYGALFEAMPFDNRFAIVELTGKDLRTLVAANLARDGGILSWAGLTARARCRSGKLDVQIHVRGKPLDDSASYKLATSDFLASGGDGVIGRLQLPETKIQVTNTIIREALADVLRGWKATPRAEIDPGRLYSSTRPRLDYEGKRPIACGAAPGSPGPDAGKEPGP
jgi:5'-nucleotidase